MKILTIWKFLDKLDTEFQINLQKYVQFSKYTTKEIIENVFNYITINQYNNDTADMFLHASGFHFLKFHVKNKQQWCSLVLLIKKCLQKNCIQNLHTWISHRTGFCLKHRTLKFWEHNFPKKQLSISKSAPPNTPLYRVSFQIKHFEISGPNMSKKGQKKVILGTEFGNKFSNSKFATLNTPSCRVSF